MEGSSELEELIGAEIRLSGAITFQRFTELALYHPRLGYYRSGRKIFGRAGDFFTSAQLQPVFGELMESFAAGLASRMPPPGDFSILELGAGTRDLSAALQNWRYQGFDWDSDPLPTSMRGLVLAHEFFDALPIHLLKKTEGAWIEIGVTRTGGSFAFTGLGAASNSLCAYAGKYGSSLPEGGLLEVCLEAREWLTRIRGLLRSGYFLVIDYGYKTRELPRFPTGTLMSYRKHAASGDVLSDPGSRDITAHVNFTFLREEAIEAGFNVVFEGSLAGWALDVWPQREFETRWARADLSWRLQWKQILFGMGEAFQVLLLQKG